MTTHLLPCAGQLEPGSSSLSVESGLFRSLAFPYAPPHTDFLLLRSPVSREQCLLPALFAACMQWSPPAAHCNLWPLVQVATGLSHTRVFFLLCVL